MFRILAVATLVAAVAAQDNAAQDSNGPGSDTNGDGLPPWAASMIAETDSNGNQLWVASTTTLSGAEAVSYEAALSTANPSSTPYYDNPETEAAPVYNAPASSTYNPVVTDAEQSPSSTYSSSASASSTKAALQPGFYYTVTTTQATPSTSYKSTSTPSSISTPVPSAAPVPVSTSTAKPETSASINSTSAAIPKSTTPLPAAAPTNTTSLPAPSPPSTTSLSTVWVKPTPLESPTPASLSTMWVKPTPLASPTPDSTASAPTNSTLSPSSSFSSTDAQATEGSSQQPPSSSSSFSPSSSSSSSSTPLPTPTANVLTYKGGTISVGPATLAAEPVPSGQADGKPSGPSSSASLQGSTGAGARVRFGGRAGLCVVVAVGMMVFI